MAESMLGGTIQFLNDLGVYDVILPFLLTFTIMFAILEKTKIFGVEKVDGEKYTRKNMNAMVAFVVAFFVIASSQLVGLINMVASQVFLLILLVVLFLMLAGILHKEGEFELAEAWKNAFMTITFIVLVLIFLNSLGWLDLIYNFLANYWNTDAISSIILLVLVVAFMSWISSSGNKTKKSKKESKGEE